MVKKGEELLKYIFLFLFGGVLYMLIEIIYRGYSDISMGCVGGVAFIAIGLLNEYYPWDMPLISQMFISSCIITFLEFVSGCILNIWLKLNIWDYSELPYNILGQICLIFSTIWFFISLIGIFLDDFIRWKLFFEEKPRYHIFYSHCEDQHS